MSVTAQLADGFRSEIRKKGEDDFRKGCVMISQSSDSEVRAFVKSAGAGRVSLAAEAVDSRTFAASCTCPNGKKGLLCRHIWATILKLEDSESDFILSKENLTAGSADLPKNDYKEKQNERARQYGKEVRQKIKAKAKAKASGSDKSPSIYPAPVEEALKYFEDNGFELKHDLTSESLESARRQLARVFHPDKGGTHDEILELNRQFEILSEYL